MSHFDEQEQRIALILGDDEIPSVNTKTLKKYFAFLKENIELPCHLTGIEDFPWEERYIFGNGSKAEYEKLKKSQPSYKGTFELLGFEEIDFEEIMLVKTKRLSDKKKFTLQLADLKATDENSKNFQLLDDYSMWFVNYR